MLDSWRRKDNVVTDVSGSKRERERESVMGGIVQRSARGGLPHPTAPGAVVFFIYREKKRRECACVWKHHICERDKGNI